MAADRTPALDGPLGPSPSLLPREISARDVRDLALAVVEGAVAAEALAKELRRSPDRSKHFAEIAERLRAVVGRATIRNALAEDATPMLAMTPPRAQSVVAPIPQSPPIAPAPVPTPPPVQPPPLPTVASVTSPPASRPATSAPNVTSATSAPIDGAKTEAPRPGPTLEELSAIVAQASHGAEIAMRMARLEHALAASIERLETNVGATMNESIQRAAAGERVVVSSPSEAIALAQRLTDRLAARGALVIRIESSGELRG